jgi:hypothetical protein
MFQDTMSLSSDLAQRMKPTWIFKLVADDLQQSVQEEVFDKVPHAHVHEAVFDKVPPAQEVREKNDIITLRELAEKIMEVVREAEGDVGDEIAIEEQDDDIAAEAARVFYEKLRAQQVDIGDDSAGENIIFM